MSTLEWSAGPRLVRREENCRDYGQRAERREREREREEAIMFV